MYTLLKILGGVALLVFATRYLREGFDRIFGARLGQWLQTVSKNPVQAFFSGMAAAFAAPSSTTMSMLAVQTLQQGHVTQRQMLVLMLGADIGLTLTVQLIALSIEQYAPIFLLFGVLLYQFSAKRTWRGVGQVILALGFLFLGVQIIKDANSGTPNAELVAVLQIAKNHPALLAVIAAGLAMVLQSSTATIGLVLSLAAASSQATGMTLELALPVVCGANVGISVTTLMVGYRDYESRRLAISNLVGKIVTTALVIALAGFFAEVLRRISGNMSYQVANAHTGFNMLKAILVIPFIPLLCKLVEWWVPTPPASERSQFGPRYIQHGPFDGPTMAMAQSAREIMYAAEIVRSMMEDLWRAMKTNDETLVRKISERDNHVDLLDAEVKKFLAKLAAQPLDDGEVQEQLRQLRYLAELESIGDIIDKNLCRLVMKKIKLGVDFSSDSWRELDDFDKKVIENMLIADTAFQTRDKELAEKLLRHKDHIDLQIRQLRDQHFARFTAEGEAEYEKSAIHLDVLTNLKRINSHVSHVAFAVIHGGNYTTTSEPRTVT